MGIEKKSLNMTDKKSVELADGDTSQEECWTTIYGSGGDELTSALVEKSGHVPVKEVVETLQVDEYNDDNSPETVKLIPSTSRRLVRLLLVPYLTK